uniref:Uncharacterized protein n=1 Tax=Serratia phage Kevin TaxID=3161161 RepID=A0AAU8KXV2_9CAUD
MRYKIVETDNFGRDYPDESFVSLPPMSKEDAIAISDVINQRLSGNSRDRFWAVVPEDYKLQPGFEP